MNDKDDELLSTYLDGELADGDVRALEERLAKELDLQVRLEAMRTADAATRKLFATVDDAPMPESVLQLLQREPATPNNVVCFPQRGLGRFLQMPVAIAASVALTIGFIASQLAQQAPGPTPSIQSLSARSIDSGSDLHKLLEESSSGQVADLGKGDRGQALLTFEDRDGRYCRQLRVDTTDSSAHAVACRRDDTWQIEALAFSDAMPDDQYQSAATTTPLTIMALVDELIGNAEAFEEDQENQVISKAWEKVE